MSVAPSFISILNGKLAATESRYILLWTVALTVSPVSVRWSVWIYDHRLHVSLSATGRMARVRGSRGWVGTAHEAGNPPLPPIVKGPRAPLNWESNGTSSSSKESSFYCRFKGKRKAFCVIYYEGKQNRADSRTSQCRPAMGTGASDLSRASL